MNFINLEKYDILKKCVKFYIRQNVKCLVFFDVG